MEEENNCTYCRDYHKCIITVKLESRWGRACEEFVEQDLEEEDTELVGSYQHSTYSMS